MLKIWKNIALTLFLVASLSGCESMTNKFNEWGRAMPTYNDAWCEGWFCWNDTTTKQEAFRPAQNPGGEVYSPAGDNYSSQQQYQQQPPPGYQYGSSQESQAAQEMGIPSPDQAYGEFKGEGISGQQDMPWQVPSQQQYGTQKSKLPPEFNSDNLPPGAVPGVNWPPVPPEEEEEEDPFGGPSLYR